MRIPPPLTRFFGKSGLEIARKIRKNVCFLTSRGWIALEDGLVLAAFYEDDFGSIFGFEAFSRIFENKEVASVFEYDKELLEKLLQIYPELAVNRDLESLLLEFRTLEIMDSLSGIGLKSLEELEISAECKGDEKNVSDSGGGECVDSLASYLSSLCNFTGVVEAIDGSTTFYFWLKNGEIVAAQISDGSFRISGISALYLCNIPAKVAKKPWSDPPDEAKCVESETELKVLLASIERDFEEKNDL